MYCLLLYYYIYIYTTVHVIMEAWESQKELQGSPNAPNCMEYLSNFNINISFEGFPLLIGSMGLVYLPIDLVVFL